MKDPLALFSQEKSLTAIFHSLTLVIAITLFLQFAWYTLAQLWLFLQGLSVGEFENLQAPLLYLGFH